MDGAALKTPPSLATEPSGRAALTTLLDASPLAIAVLDLEGIVRSWNGAAEAMFGWTAGGGIEHAVTDHILVRGEYRHSDFGNKDFGSAIGDVGATQDKVLFGSSYKF